MEDCRKIIHESEIRFVRMYKVLMITNPSVVVVPNMLSKQVLTTVLNVLKLLD